MLKQEIPLKGSRVDLTYERPIVVFKSTLMGAVHIGAYSYTNNDTVIYSTKIGRFTSIAHKVMIAPTEHPTDWLSTSGFAFGDANVFRHYPDFHNILSDEVFTKNREKTQIGNDVWIGYGVFIKRGITIGDGAVIAANATVVDDVPPYAIVGGTPAKIIKMRFSAEIINKFLKVKWWEYELNKKIIGNIKYSDVSASLEKIEDLISKDKLKKLSPPIFNQKFPS